MNALKHGLNSKHAVVRGIEDPAEFEALVRNVLAVHGGDPIVELAAERLVATAWRLRRVRRVETEKLNERALSYVRSQDDLASARDQLARLSAWSQATQRIRYGPGKIAPADVDGFTAAVEHLFATADLPAQGVSGPVDYVAIGIERIIDRDTPVTRRVVNTALDAARRELPPALAQSDLPSFLNFIQSALWQRERDTRGNIEQQEGFALKALIAGLELGWQDERSISDAERRLDAQFSRALRDFHEARTASQANDVGERSARVL